MIAYVKGKITVKHPTFVVVETGGIGYQINISLNTYSKVEKLENVQLFTYYHVKEDSLTLYGFFDEAERMLFVHLIGVSGIGPNTARVLLSSMKPEEARNAIIMENVKALSSVKGLGPKTAKRLIVELKDKLMKDGGIESGVVTAVNGESTNIEEALSALVALGFNKMRVQQALNKVLKENPEEKDVEGMIKLALKMLS